MPNDGLFAVPEPEHPDAAVARQEIAAYYEDLVAAARAKLAAAQAKVDEAEGALSGWTERGELAPGKFEATLIAGHAGIRYHKLVLAAIDARESARRRQLHTEAWAAGAREEALRRWLTAQGHDLGDLALPAPDDRAAKRGRRGTRG